MKKTALFVLMLTPLLSSQAIADSNYSDSQIRKILIQQSMSSYSGNCPCPYNSMRNGRQCGGRSAYSRPSGSAPLCYEQDVSKQMVEAYRRSLH